MSDVIECLKCGMEVEWMFRDLKLCAACIKQSAPLYVVNPPVSDAFTGSASDICENCRYSVKTFKYERCGPIPELFCHRFPPIYMNDGRGTITIGWPRVLVDDFCGEFMAKPVEASDGD